MVRKSFAPVLIVVVLSSFSAFASEDSSPGAARLRDRDQPFIGKVIRVVKSIKKVVANSFLIGDPRP